MLKVALLAATLLMAGSTATAADGVAEPVAAPTLAPANEAPCHPPQSFDLACAKRPIDAVGDGAISATELANFAVPAADWAPLRPTHGTGLDFKDAALEPGSVLHAQTEHDGPQRLLISTLLALAALVILLRKRPT